MPIEITVCLHIYTCVDSHSHNRHQQLISFTRFFRKGSFNIVTVCSVFDRDHSVRFVQWLLILNSLKLYFNKLMLKKNKKEMEMEISF